MKKRFSSSINWIIVSLSGLIVLAGYFLPFSWLHSWQNALFVWAIGLSGIALWIGIIYLSINHFKKMIHEPAERFYSFIFLITFGITVILTSKDSLKGSFPLWLYNTILVPVETSLLALLTVILLFAMMRYIIRGHTLYSHIFIGTVLIMFIGSSALNNILPFSLLALQEWIQAVPGMAGMRGILLGVALGGIVTGIRVLLGMEKPYHGRD